MLRRIICGLTLTLAIIPYFAFAADTNTATTTTATEQGLTVSPPLRELTIKHGNTEDVTVKLSNPTKSLIEVYPQVMDFTSRDDSGDPQFLDPSEKSRTYSLSAWIKFSADKIALAPEQITSWQYSIIVPDDAGAGGHYGAIMFSDKPPVTTGSQSQVGISSMVASLALVTVPGDIKEQALVSEFSSPKSFYFKPPVDITTKITNNGNDHIIPAGNVVIKNWAGTQVANYTINDVKGRILPEGVRKFDTKWDPATTPFYKIPIGRFTAQLSAIYGTETTQSLNASLTFWVIPLWLIFTVSGIILALIILFTILHIRKKRRFLYT